MCVPDLHNSESQMYFNSGHSGRIFAETQNHSLRTLRLEEEF